MEQEHENPPVNAVGAFELMANPSAAIDAAARLYGSSLGVIRHNVWDDRPQRPGGQPGCDAARAVAEGD